MSDVAEAVYAGLDLGTSGCKGVLVTADGRVVARAAARYPTHRPEPGAAEQHPGDWLNAVTSVTLGLARAVAADRWQAVGLSAMLPTFVLTAGVGAAATPGGIDAPDTLALDAAHRYLVTPMASPGSWGLEIVSR